MTVIKEPTATPDLLHTVWSVLDEASQALVRAESIVVLMGVEPEASVHHAHASEVACDLLRTLREKLDTAQDLVNLPRQRRALAAARRGADADD